MAGTKSGDLLSGSTSLVKQGGFEQEFNEESIATFVVISCLNSG